MPREHMIGILCMIILYAAFFFIYKRHSENIKKKELLEKTESAVDDNKGDV
jgi:hypothetical protein